MKLLLLAMLLVLCLAKHRQLNHSVFGMWVGKIVHIENDVIINYTPAPRRLNLDERKLTEARSQENTLRRLKPVRILQDSTDETD